jgi:IS1 family transposase
VCWRYWQRVGEEVRIWTMYRDASRVLIASLTGERTRLTCDGRTATL